MLFADRTCCPDCRSALVAGRDECPRCAIRLTGEVAWQLFAALEQADRLVLRLRAEARSRAVAPVAAPVTVPVSAPATAPAPRTTPMTAGLAAYPRPAGAVPTPAAGAAPQRGMLESGVPKLLLGLGAACLLVGALVFLAVAWVLMGVEGRTAVLVGTTVGAGALTAVLARRGLPAASEALAAVTSGLTLLACVGADAAGWLGNPPDGVLPAQVGAVLGALGAALALGARRTPLGRLLAGEVVVVLGAVLVAIGTTIAAPTAELGLVIGTLLLGALALVAQLGGFRLLPPLAAGCAGLAWLALSGAGLGRAVTDVSVTALWGRAEVWPLLAAVLLALAAAAVPLLPRPLRATALGAGGATLAPALLLPLHDVSLDAGVVGWSLLLLLVAAAAPLVPAGWRAALTGPGAIAVLVPLVALVDVLGRATDAALTPRGDLRLTGAATLLTHPWLALLATAALTAALGAVLDQHVPASRGDRGGVLRSTTFLASVAGLLAATGVAVTATYAVPLALVVAELLVTAVAAAALATPAALRHHRQAATTGAGPALVAALGAVVVATPSAGLQALALVVLVGTAGGAAALLRTGLGTLALTLLAPASALLVVDLGRVTAQPTEPVLAVALAVVGLLLVAVARPANELAVAVVAAVLTSAVAAGADPLTWLAVHLTVAGTAAAVAALVRPTRRPLAWVGGALLVVASWVRLADTGITVAEAYTLPAALVLLTVGVVTLLRDPRRRTTPMLLSGLALALGPSTLLALDEPATLRGLLVALASLALVLGGASLRWSAPLVAGSVAGALLLLRALAPYAAELPPYVVMIAAGALLVTVGVTWEDRLASLRRGRRYVARLR
ncbi:hypothetical protein QE364_001034 [Nocardioides zeae]|uniref:Uncharacterized protein n=1 Tax=Nocardioides zeae TaxID=1457234 RepID=A0ACC6IF44_9ACTN|nr:hypothetical protein [Nocardioides zeae]MDR6174848.1 hypothetical protein [Nocardioides zeae]MDR6209342.1 hypothetical protein [Nocardioides zeae]